MTAPKRPVDVRAEIINIEMAVVERLRSERVRVPPYPAVCARLQEAGSDPRCTVRTLAEIVATDPALAANVMRQASTAAYGRTGPAALEPAIGRLGVVELLRMATAGTIGKSALSGGVLAALRRDVWRRALISARLSTLLAPRRGIDTGLGYLAGLLHEFGAIVVVATLEDVANERRLAVLPETAWRELTNKFAAEFGRVLAERWELPPVIATVITAEHTAEPCVQLIAMVDEIISVLDRGGALSEVSALTDDERTEIVRALAKLAEQMASAERAAPPSASLIEASIQEAGWPLALDLAIKGQVGRVERIWEDRFAFVSRVPLAPNWLAQVDLRADPRVDIVANVRSCEQRPDGTYLVTAQPYGLAGAQRDAWLRIVERARCH